MADNVKNSFIVVVPNQTIKIPLVSNLAWFPLFCSLPKDFVSKSRQYPNCCRMTNFVNCY